jgi:hypothetical protein
MEINSNLNTGGVSRTPPSETTVVHGARGAREEVTFENAAALEKSLRETPDTRDHVIAMAKQLVSDVQYPPPETIRKISNLLALNLIAESK